MSYGRVSPLHLAAKAQGVYALDVFETLLANGADANARTSQSGRNETPLMVVIDQLSLRPSRFPALAAVHKSNNYMNNPRISRLRQVEVQRKVEVG